MGGEHRSLLRQVQGDPAHRGRLLSIRSASCPKMAGSVFRLIAHNNGPHMAPLLTMQGIDKRFAGIPALRSADLVVEKGEVHALIGQNGAGKSTMIKILTGYYRKDD